MTMSNPQQINKAKYYVDTRNQWCEDCKDRITDGDMPDAIAPQLNCTECEAFAAGIHPEQHGKGKCQPVWVQRKIKVSTITDYLSQFESDDDISLDGLAFLFEEEEAQIDTTK